MKGIPQNCPYLIEKGEEPSFVDYCSGYDLPNPICQKCRSFYENYWKDKYGTEWAAGTSRVKHVLKVLRKRFPNLTIEPTEYAVSEEYIPPNQKHKKHEPNVMVKDEDTTVCDIEVTGSDIKMTPPNDIFIPKGKYMAAQKRKKGKNMDTWFYTVYRNSEYVLDLDLIGKFDADKAHVKYLKRVPELYIQIPCSQAYPREKLFAWIEEKL